MRANGRFKDSEETLSLLVVLVETTGMCCLSLSRQSIRRLVPCTGHVWIFERMCVTYILAKGVSSQTRLRQSIEWWVHSLFVDVEFTLWWFLWSLGDLCQEALASPCLQCEVRLDRNSLPFLIISRSFSFHFHSSRHLVGSYTLAFEYISSLTTRQIFMWTGS